MTGTNSFEENHNNFLVVFKLMLESICMSLEVLNKKINECKGCEGIDKIWKNLLEVLKTSPDCKIKRLAEKSLSEIALLQKRKNQLVSEYNEEETKYCPRSCKINSFANLQEGCDQLVKSFEKGSYTLLLISEEHTQWLKKIKPLLCKINEKKQTVHITTNH